MSSYCVTEVVLGCFTYVILNSSHMNNVKWLHSYVSCSPQIQISLNCTFFVILMLIPHYPSLLFPLEWITRRDRMTLFLYLSILFLLKKFLDITHKNIIVSCLHLKSTFFIPLFWSEWHSAIRTHWILPPRNLERFFTDLGIKVPS